MESIKVSVLVPIYNVEKYLRQCLDSLKNQTLHDIEIICINDGSTDSSPEIIREYCEDDDRFKVINKANSGYGDSMNQGLAMARGEYIGIVESDDFASPDMFESLYTLASENDADVTKSNYLEYSLNGYEVRDFPVENLFFCEFNKVFTPADDQNVFLSAPAIWSAIYRREYLEKNNIRFLPTPGASFQDTSFNFKALALADRAILTHDAYLHYRVDNASSSVKSQAKIFTVCDEYDEIWDFINRYPELRAKLATAIPIFQFGGYIWNLRRLVPKLQHQFYEHFAETFRKLWDEGVISRERFNDYDYGFITGMLKDPDAHFENNFGPIEVNTSYIIMATECSAEDFRVFAEQLAAYADKSSEIFCVINNYPDFVDAFNGLRDADKRFFEGKSLFDNEFACTIDFDSIRSDRLVICKVPEIFDNYRVSETAAADSELTKPSLPDEFAHLTVLMKRKSSMAHFYCSHFSDLMFGIYGTQTLSGLECPVNLPLLFTSYYAQYINDGDVPKLPEEFALPKSFFSPCLPDDYEDAVSKITDVITWTHDPLMNPVAGISAFEKAQRQLNGVWKSACSLIHLIPFEFANKVARQTTSPDNSVFYYNGTTTDQRDYRFDASVIIPVYNMENYIAECLDSVLAQRDITIQVICVNDGSTDNSLDVLLGYAYNDGRITVISQLNEGASGARNRAIDFATGDFLAFMDPDDFYPNDHVLADLIRSARRKGVPLCGGTLACVDTDTEEYLDIYQREAVHYMYETEEYRTFGQDQFDYGWIRFIYSKELFTNGKNRFPHLSFYEDPLFLMNIVTQVERYYVLPEVVYCYRINYKERDWQRWQVEDVLKGIKKNLDAAKKYGYSELYSTLIKRLEDDYYAPIMKFKHAPEILELLSQIQAGLDVSMIEKAKKLDFGQYLIRPLRDLALSAPAPEPGPPDVALVRMARRLSDSSAYHLSQKAFLGLKRRLGIEE